MCRFIVCVLAVDMCILVVFFFKQKTAYEMRISDWSSDVCSSDLTARPFTDTTPPEQPWYEIDVQENTWIPDVAKIGAALAVFALVFFMVLRPFMKKAMKVTTNTPRIPCALSQRTLLRPGDDQAMKQMRQKLRTLGGLPPETLTDTHRYDENVAVDSMSVAEDIALAR